MRLLKKLTFLLLFLLSFSTAVVFQSEGNIYIAEDQEFVDDLYLVGNVIRFDGKVTGDIFAIAKEIQINGSINGDINLVAKKVNLNQKSVNTVRILAKEIVVKGIIKKDLIAACEIFDLSEKSIIIRNALIAANEMKIGGLIRGNANLKAGFLQFKPGTVIEGDLEYGAPKTRIEKDLIVRGKIKILEKEIEKKASIINLPPWLKFITSKFFGNLYSLTILFIFGLIFIKFLPAQTADIIHESLRSPGRSFLSGILVSVLTPLVAILLAFTVIGIPFALIVLSFFGLGLYLSKIFIIVILGKYLLVKILRKDIVDTKTNQARELFVGLILYFIISNIPNIGFLFASVTSMIAFGAFMRTRVDMYKRGIEKGVF